MRSVFFSTILLFMMNNAFAQHHGKYRLVWSDEFNVNGVPDSTKWTYEQGFVRNQELQWYQPQNAHCENGHLVIEARREEKPNPLFVAGSTDWRKARANIAYTSACLITKGLHAWKYGRFEMRARFGIDEGLWPAWWTLGVSKSWPANGEIDIMEYYRKKLLANIACLGPDGKPEWFSKTRNIDSLGGQAWAKQFHVWRMDWDESAIALYVDGILLNKVALTNLIDKDGSHFEPFRQPHYMLVNLAVGGQSGGDPTHTSFPSRYEIDYIRVYEKQ